MRIIIDDRGRLPGPIRDVEILIKLFALPSPGSTHLDTLFTVANHRIKLISTVIFVQEEKAYFIYGSKKLRDGTVWDEGHIPKAQAEHKRINDALSKAVDVRKDVEGNIFSTKISPNSDYLSWYV